MNTEQKFRYRQIKKFLFIIEKNVNGKWKEYGYGTEYGGYLRMEHRFRLTAKLRVKLLEFGEWLNLYF